MSANDRETRERLLATATRLFAARGFKNVTVRAICRDARANVAAVNYHFGDKLGLYREVLNRAIAIMQSTTDRARDAGRGRPPEERLRRYIRVFLRRVVGAGQDSWIHQLMSHEMADPTPALDLVADQVIRPRLAYLAEIVAELLGRSQDDEQVRQSVLSVQVQCHMARATPIARRFLPNLQRIGTIDRLADHIAVFSLGGIHALRAGRDAAPKPSSRRVSRSG
jgi:AcrR family transcriptional regulator